MAGEGKWTQTPGIGEHLAGLYEKSLMTFYIKLYILLY